MASSLQPPLSWILTVGIIAVVVTYVMPMASADEVIRNLSTAEGNYPATEMSPTSGKILSRHRRYLVFPEGSTFNAAFCNSVKAYVMRDMDMFSFAVAWGISYDLPNNSRALASSGAGIEPGDELSKRGRRDRRDLYRRLERAVESTGINGRACMLRAVCESRYLPSPGGKEKAPRSLPLELLRVLLNVPVDSLSPSEPYEHHEYATARRLGIDGEDCASHFPDCSTSFVSLAASLTPWTHNW